MRKSSEEQDLTRTPSAQGELSGALPSETQGDTASAYDLLANGPSSGSPPEWGEETKAVRRLGQSEHGEVYLVEHLDKLESHKVVAHESAQSAFKTALATRRIDHPNIVKIYGTYTLGDHDVLRMEYVPGSDLARHVLEKGALAPDRAVLLVRQIADALSAAHEAGVHHGGLTAKDLILREDSPEVIVTDFGVRASRDDVLGDAARDVRDLARTVRFLLTGTPQASECPPYVEEGLWRLLEQMHTGEVENMAEVRSRLDDYIAAGADELVAQLREADSLLARCDFEEAEKALRRAAGQAAGKRKQEIEQRVDQVAELREEHEELVQEARKLLKEWRHTECSQLLSTARARFSGSAELQSRREHLRQRLEVQYRTAEEKVREALQELDFEAADDVIAQLEQILADEHARRELSLALGHAPTPIDWLREEADKKKTAYKSHLERADEAITAFDFPAAMEACTQLETHFPNRENLIMLRRLKQAEDLFGLATAYEEDLLRQLAEEPGEAPPLSDLRLAGALRACSRLLEDFDTETYPTFARIERLQSLLQDAAEAVKAHVAHNLSKADEAHESGRILEELQWLEACATHVSDTDLFEGQDRQVFENRRVTVESQVARAEELYRQGKQLCEGRSYAQARLALSDLQTLVPHGYRDTQELLEEVEEAQQRFAGLSDQVERSLAEIEDRRFSTESVVQTLRHAEELFALSNDADRSRRQPLLVRAMTAVLRATEAEQLHGLGPIIAELPEERWRDMCQSPELTRAARELTYVAPANPESFPEVLAHARGRVTELQKVARLLRALPANEDHPAALLSADIAYAFSKLETREQQSQIGEALVLLESLAHVAPDELEPELAERRTEIRRAADKARVTGAARKLAQVGLMALPAIATLILGIFLGRTRKIEGELLPTPTQIPTSSQELVDMELANLPGPNVRAWLAAADGPADTRRRVALIEGWLALRHHNADGADSRHILETFGTTASWMRGDEHKELFEILSADAARATELALRIELDTARRRLANQPMDRRVILSVLSDRLRELESALKRGGLHEQAKEVTALLTPLRSLAATTALAELTNTALDDTLPEPLRAVAIDYARGEIVALLDDAVLSASAGGTAKFTDETWRCVELLARLQPTSQLTYDETHAERTRLLHRAVNRMAD